MTTATTTRRDQRSSERPRAPRSLAALSGVVAAALTLGVAQLLAAVLNPTSTPLLVLGSAVIDRVPAWLKNFAVENFGSNDKTVLLGTMGVVVAVLAALAGLLELRRRGFGAALVAVLGVVSLIAAVTRANAGMLDFVPTLLGFVLGAVALGVLVDRLRTSTAAAPSTAGSSKASSSRPGSSRPGSSSAASSQAGGRRSFLVAFGVTAAAAAITGAGGQLVGAAGRSVNAARAALKLPKAQTPAGALPAGVEVDVKGVTPFTTPNADFYRVDTALSVPRIDPSSWQLRIHGMVEEEVTVSYADLQKAALVESRVTLTCVSNEVGGNLAGNALWLGAPIAAFLERARPKSGADMVLSSSSDGFSASTPLDVLTDPDSGALFAIGMNGEPLPIEHGFPVRMVVPGLYGFVSATKWVVDLEVTTFAKKTAYWTDRGWSAKAPIKTASRIDVPAGFARVDAGTVAVGGVAWAQTRGVAKVEVKVDNGPWQNATLGTEASRNTWRQWSFAWKATSGTHTLTVRATDGTGATQSSDRLAPIPNGATGWQSVQVTVS